MEKGSTTSKRGNTGPKIYTSKEIELDISKLEKEFYRADIEIHKVDHSGPSYEGRLFLNNPNANHDTELKLENGYVGSYNIFGHGGCFGDEGHCEVPMERMEFDHRPSHHLMPQYKRVIITDALKKIGKNASKFTVTIVPYLYGEPPEGEPLDVVKFEKIGIITYDST